MAFLIVLLAASALLTAVVAQSGLPPVDNTDAIGVVETTATTGTGPAKGMTTYKLALKLGSDAGNVYTIFGDENRPMSFPPAFQIPTPFGVNIAGVNPAFFPLGKGSQFDSWLTVGMVNGEASNSLSTIGLDFKHWSTESGLSTTNGAVFWMNPKEGPSTADCDGLKGKSNSAGDVVIAQLTVPTGKPYEAIVNCQGHTKEYFQGHTKDGKALKESNYDSVKITFSFGAGSNGGGH